VGIEPYQHPDRSETTHLSLDLDHFSALVIYVALRALAVDPTLWTRYVERPAYDKLLFRVEDFLAPEASPLCRDLRYLPAEDVRELTEKLVSLFRVRLDQVPPLSHLTHSYAKIERLLAGRQWEAAVELLNRRGQFRDAPKHLKPLIHQAYEHVCRQQAWAAFQRLPHQASELGDRKLVNAWNEVLFAGFEPAERERPRVTAARKNVAVLDRLHHLVQQSAQQTTFFEERNLAAAAKHLPEEYEYSLKPRVELARRRVAAINQLEHALRQPIGEGAIVAAWRKVVGAQCERFVNAEHRGRIALAEKRSALVEALQAVPEGLSPDQLDRRLLELWDEELAEGCTELEAWRPAYREAVYRKGFLERIEQAIQSGSDAAILELLEDPCVKDYSLPAGWGVAIRTARDRIAKTEALLAALGDGDRASFCDLFDARILRKYGDRFARYRSLLSQWTQSEVLPLEGLGLGRALGRASLFCVDEADGAYRVRWTWPQQRFADECLLAVCAREPGPQDDPRDLDVQYRLPLDRQNWESGGGSRVIHAKPEWAGSYVVVWAMVDLGFSVFASQPLVLGRLEGGKRRSGRRPKGWNLWRLVGRSKSRAEPGKPADPNWREDSPP
jgi:hypothetical protein